MRTASNGFTLVEIMIAVMIVGLLAAMATPAVVKARDRAQRGICLDNQRMINQALQQYLFENPEEENVALADLAEYFNHSEIPECPKEGTYTLSIDPVEVSCSFAGHER